MSKSTPPGSSQNEQPAAQFESAFALFEPSRKAIVLNLVTFIELVIVPIILSGIEIIFLRHSGHSVNLNYSMTATSTSPGASYFAVNGVSFLLFLLVAPAVILTLLKSVKGEKIDLLPALSQGMRYLGNFIVLAISLVVTIGVGFLLFILPGIWLYQRFFLAPYYMIDQKMGPFAAMGASWRAASKYSGAVWGVLGVTVLLAIGASLLSLVPLIGWLLGVMLVAVYYAAPAIRYYQIIKADRT